MKRKILHVISSLNDGGAEGVLYKLASYNSKDIEHVVVSLTCGEKYNKLLSKAGIRVKNLHMKGVRKSLLDFFSLCFFIYKEKPSVVQTWMYHADLIGGIAASLMGVRNIVWNIRSGEIHHSQKFTTKAFIKVSALLSRYIPNAIISCSSRAIEIHKEVGYKGKMILIDNGIDGSLYYPSYKKRAEVREEFSILDSSVLVGMVARFDPQKDHLNLLKAISRIDQDNYKIILVGSGTSLENTTLLQWIDELRLLDKVILVGQRSDIHRIMCGIDFLVLPSLYGEAFPNVTIEAMSTGTPCIVTDIGDSARVVGDCGWVVRPNSPKELSDKIRAAINMKVDDSAKYDNLSKSCIDRVNQKFLIKEMFSGYKRVWCEK